VRGKRGAGTGFNGCKPRRLLDETVEEGETLARLEEVAVFSLQLGAKRLGILGV
jgi:hypothetical protein